MPNVRAVMGSIAVLLSLAGNHALAQVTVSDPWVRGTAAGQNSTVAYMQLTSATDATLVAIASPAAKIVELHEMKVDGGIMKMGAATNLSLPAGKPVALAPGGYHVMLVDLARPLREGDQVPLTLTVTGKDGKTQKIEVSARVRALTSHSPTSRSPG